MIDRERRSELAELLRHFLAGQLTNDEFVKRSPRKSQDPAISAVLDDAWFLYDDLQTHRLAGRWRIVGKRREVVARWVLFLKTEREYEWPQSNPFVRFPMGIANLVTLGTVAILWRRRESRIGDPSVWPFLRRSDFEEANAHPPYLVGAR